MFRTDGENNSPLRRPVLLLFKQGSVPFINLHTLLSDTCFKSALTKSDEAIGNS